jgi:predicted anti-sigma-YlaC factor YlaD
MRCEDIKVIMGALADGEVAPRIRSEAEAHLKACTACRAEHSAQLQVKGLLSNLPQEDAPAFLMTRVMADIKARKGAKSPAKLRWAYSSAAALLLLLFAVVTVSVMHPAGNLENSGIYKSLPTESSEMAPASVGGLTPASMETEYSTFGDFVQQRHEDVRDSLRVHREFSPGLENTVKEIKGSDGIYKELPKDKDEEKNK